MRKSKKDEILAVQKDKQKVPRADESSSDSEESSEEHEVQEATEPKSSAAFVNRRVFNPIQTVVGPIYEYEPSPENVPSFPTIASFGARRSGKSTSFDNFMYHCFGEYQFGIVLTRTKSNGFWQQRVPDRFIFQLDSNFRVDILQALLERQEKMMEEHGADSPLVPAFCILDDVIADQKAIRYSAELNSFFSEGRHKRLGIAITSQYIKGIGPLLRTNTDLIFIQPIYNVAEREALWVLYGGMMTKKEWMQLMGEIVYANKLEGHTPAHPHKEVQIMVVEGFEQTEDPSEKFYHWKPKRSEDLPPYRLCHDDYWNETGAEKKEKSEKKDKATVTQLFDQFRAM